MKTSQNRRTLKVARYNIQSVTSSSSSRRPVSPSSVGVSPMRRKARIVSFKSISPAPAKKWLAAA